jgi:hypothetical protein
VTAVDEDLVGLLVEEEVGGGAAAGEDVLRPSRRMNAGQPYWLPSFAWLMVLLNTRCSTMVGALITFFGSTLLVFNCSYVKKGPLQYKGTVA